LLSLLPLALGACASAIVGGECEEGYSVCHGACVDLRNDSTNCGFCGNNCSGASSCVAGACVIGEGGLDLGSRDLGGDDAGDADLPDGALRDGAPGDGSNGERDGSLPDGAVDDGSVDDSGTDDGGGAGDGSVADGSVSDGGTSDGGVRDGSVADGGVSDGSVADGGVSDGSVADGGGVDGGPDDGGAPLICDIGQIPCGDVCVRTESDPANCGSCGHNCLATEVCSAGVCAPLCEVPLVACSRHCVDLQSDPDHCGTCPNVCATGICIDATCSSGTAGHVVLIGHDYSTPRIGMNRVAGNSVFLGSGSPVRVLVYQGRARAASITGTDVAINQVATARGRSWARTPVTRAEVTLQLASAEVLVVYAQGNETDAELQAIGVEWSVALLSFVRRGGVIVVFDTNSGSNVGTFQLLASAGLLNVTSRTVITGATVTVDSAALGDAVAIGVPSMYRAETTSVRFDATDPLTVVRDSIGPVVIHRVVAP
jgi:hypothetical protein